MRRIALVGCAKTWRDAPWDDPGWMIWAHCSMQPLLSEDQIARVSCWFDLHHVTVWRAGKVWYRPTREAKTYVDWLGLRSAPVVMQQHYPIVPTSVTYPLREIVETFGIVPTEWKLTPEDDQWWTFVRDRGEFSSTFAYMVAYALYEGVDELAVYGVDFAGNDPEYQHQRPGAKYWIGMARGLNVPVTIAAGSWLEAQPWLYGYELPPAPPTAKIQDPMWFVEHVAHA